MPKDKKTKLLLNVIFQNRNTEFLLFICEYNTSEFLTEKSSIIKILACTC